MKLWAGQWAGQSSEQAGPTGFSCQPLPAEHQVCVLPQGCMGMQREPPPWRGSILMVGEKKIYGRMGFLAHFGNDIFLALMKKRENFSVSYLIKGEVGYVYQIYGRC